MPEPIHEPETAAATPLEYRSGKDDFKGLSRYWQLDGPRVRAGLWLLGLFLGFLASGAISWLIASLSPGSGDSFPIVLQIFSMVLQLVFVRRMAKRVSIRTNTAIRGAILGIMVIPIVWIFLVVYAWINDLQ